MKRLLVLLAAAGLAAGYSGLTAGRGLLRVQDARSEGGWNGSLMLECINGSFSYDQVYRPEQIGMEPGTRLTARELTANVGISPLEWFEMFCWTGGALETWRWQEADSMFSGYHNIVPGIKLSVPVIPVVKVGAVGAYSMYPNFGDVRGGWSVDSAGNGRFGLPFVNGPSWTALLTFAFDELDRRAPVLHLNYGQAYDKDENDVQTDYTTLAGALDYHVGKLEPFVEFSSVQSGGAGPLDNSGRVYVTPGLKVGYLAPVVLEAGVSLGLTDNVPDYEIVAGLGVAGRLFKPKQPRTGSVTGRVIDAATGEGLPASVVFGPEAGVNPAGTDAKGVFTARGVRPGTFRVTASASGYLPAELDVALTAGRTVNIELALTREVTTGSIAGQVTDPVSGAPLAARVSLSNGVAVSVDADGKYRFDNLTPGEYTIEASAPSYLTATTKTRVSALVEQRADFQLVKTGVKITLKVYFDTDKAELRPESHQALADAAKIMNENPGIKVEIHGHTDNVGSAGYNQKLSQRRAQAVVDYLAGLGIAQTRLTPRGFGLTRPVAPNETPEGRAQNRRVEFVVVE